MGKSAKAHKRVTKQERISKKQQAEILSAAKPEKPTPKGGVPKQGMPVDPVSFYCSACVIV